MDAYKVAIQLAVLHILCICEMNIRLRKQIAFVICLIVAVSEHKACDIIQIIKAMMGHGILVL